MAAGRELLIGLRRTPLLSTLSVLTIAVALFAVGLYGLVALNIERAISRLEAQVEIRAFLADATESDVIVTAMKDIDALPGVAAVEYVSSEQALAQARRELSEFSDVLEGEFLPASFDVRLEPGHRDPASVEAIVKGIAAYDFVDDVRYGEDWVREVYDIRNIAAAAGLVLGTAFAVVAVIIIASTIRMTVMARAEEIAIMKLVGATDGYIRRPFLLDGLLKGLLGGALALLLTWGAHALVTRYVLRTEFFEPRVVLLGILAGALLGTIGSLLSVGRHLRRV